MRIEGPASMRPRRMAAENDRGRRHPGTSGGGASMRPRRMAAENGRFRLRGACLLGASMRPRRMAAENPRRHASPRRKRIPLQ